MLTPFSCVSHPPTVNTPSQSFTLTGSTNSPVGSVVGAVDCNKDWLTIPCVSDSAIDPTSNCQDRICGDNLNVITSTTGGNVVVFSEYINQSSWISSTLSMCFTYK